MGGRQLEKTMPGINQPYRRTVRQFAAGDYFQADGYRDGGGNSSYVTHQAFANEPDKYVRAFLLLQNDLKRLFEYIEPTDANSSCYSFRIHEVLLRACIEVEANCKAVLKENGYQKLNDWNISDYKKIEASHRLSAFQVKMPIWHGSSDIRTPFASWASGGSLPWYKAYNATKHDRHVNFAMASFGHAVDAVCGLLALLSAQFVTHDFDPTSSPWGRGAEGGSFWPAIGSYFIVRFPDDWPDDERYDFSAKDRQNMKTQSDPFQQFHYP
jgi:hypothetical protein